MDSQSKADNTNTHYYHFNGNSSGNRNSPPKSLLISNPNNTTSTDASTANNSNTVHTISSSTLQCTGIPPDSGGDDCVDPRVAIELESLNSATNEINKLEKELEKANLRFRQLLSGTSGQLETMAKKIGLPIIDRARPFYQALTIAHNAHKACLSAATQFSRANDLHSAAKTTENAITESKFNTKCLDNVLQEVLNHATMKVMEAEKMKKDSELSHRLRAEEFTKAESRVHELEKHLRREIEKSRPYFELKNCLDVNLSSVKTEIENIQTKIVAAKSRYACSLNRLESISEEIHFQRNNVNKSNNRNGTTSYTINNGNGESSSSRTVTIPTSPSGPYLNCESPDEITISNYPSSSSSSSICEEQLSSMNGFSLLKRTSPIGAEAETELEQALHNNDDNQYDKSSHNATCNPGDCVNGNEIVTDLTESI